MSTPKLFIRFLLICYLLCRSAFACPSVCVPHVSSAGEGQKGERWGSREHRVPQNRSFSAGAGKPTPVLGRSSQRAPSREHVSDRGVLFSDEWM